MQENYCKRLKDSGQTTDSLKKEAQKKVIAPAISKITPYYAKKGGTIKPQETL